MYVQRNMNSFRKLDTIALPFRDSNNIYIICIGIHSTLLCNILHVLDNEGHKIIQGRPKKAKY